MSVAIKIDGLGKRYRLGEGTSLNTIADVAASRVAKMLGRAADTPNTGGSDFWALRDVSCTIQTGDRLGIIGGNGAGKSTLLKILSRVTRPTEGSVTLKGRVGSLLEVGTGFHPELTGRENIYLNGSILGLSRTQIKSRFDEIVAFADVARFLDTPVKRYSSGMSLRLAFAVAAHLEPDVFIIDEVLAVGDAEFQKKCVGKLQDNARAGRTVVFVSHSMNSVQRLCNRVIWLQGGSVKMIGDVDEVTTAYLSAKDADRIPRWENTTNAYNDKLFSPTAIWLGDRYGNTTSHTISNNGDVWVHISGQLHENDPALTIGYAIYSHAGELLYWSYQTDHAADMWPKMTVGENHLKSRLPTRLLNEGRYRIELAGGLHFREWLFEPGRGGPAIEFQIAGGLSDSPLWTARRPGLLAPVITWEVSDV